jgi:hypothetical protein
MSRRLAIGKLGKGHAEELVPAGELLHPLVAAVAPDQPPKSVRRQMVHELNEHGASLVHWPLLSSGVAHDARDEPRAQVDDCS